MPRIEKSGYRKWWPMKEFQRKDSSGRLLYKEVYRNMETGETHYPVDKDGKYVGWNGEPPPLAIGESPVPGYNSKYAENYDKIQWNRK